jgi:hypothetical protein
MPQPLPYVNRVQQRTIVLGPAGGDQLEFPQWGYLIGGEADAVAAADQQPELFRRTAVLSNTIADATGQPRATMHGSVLRMLSAVMGATVTLSADEEAWRLQWGQELAELLRFQTQAGIAMRNAAVAALIAHRVEGQSDYSPEDVARLAGPLREAIFGFYQAESAGTSEMKTTEDQLKELEDELGKLLPAHGSRGESTGTMPSGAASASTPATQTSAAKGSSASRSRTSSTRSKRAKLPNVNGFTGANSPSPS